MAANFDPAASQSLRSKPRSPFGDFLRNFLRNRTALFGFLIVLILAFVGASGFYFTVMKANSEDRAERESYELFSPVKTELKDQLIRPTYDFAPFVEELQTGVSSKKAELEAAEKQKQAGGEEIIVASRAHPLGTDDLGRDVLLKLWSGSTYSLLVGLLAVGISVFIGIMVGGIAGFYGRDKARFPFLLTLLLPCAAYIVGTIRELGALAPILSYVIYAAAAALMLMQIVLALRNGSVASVVFFFVAIGLALGANFYANYVYSGNASGYSLVQAEAAQDAFQKLKDESVDAKAATDSYESVRLAKLEAQLEYQRTSGRVVNNSVDDDPQVKELKQEAIATQAIYLLAMEDYKVADAHAKLAKAEAETLRLEALVQGTKDAIAAEKSKSEPDADALAGLEQALEKQNASVERARKSLPASVDALDAAKHARLVFTMRYSKYLDQGEVEDQREILGEAVGLIYNETPELTSDEQAAKAKALESAKTERAEAEKAAQAEAKADTLMPIPASKIREDIYSLRKQQPGFRATIKDVQTELTEKDWFYKYSRNVVLLILMGIFVLVTFLFVVRAAQVASRESRLAWMFFPVMTIDNFVMRAIEVLMTMPQLFLLLTVLAVYADSRSIWLVMFIIGVTSWMGTARFVRAEILSLREREFIQAARALGLKDGRIIIRHLVPNSLSPVLVSATIGVAGAILLESTLSFLGLGAKAEEVTWGKMLSDGRGFITTHPYLMIIPGIAIFIVVLAFNLLGEGLREAMNPRLRKR